MGRPSSGARLGPTASKPRRHRTTSRPRSVDSALKHRDGGVDGVLLVVRDTHRTRAFLRELKNVAGSTFPVPGGACPRASGGRGRPGRERDHRPAAGRCALGRAPDARFAGAAHKRPRSIDRCRQSDEARAPGARITRSSPGSALELDDDCSPRTIRSRIGVGAPVVCSRCKSCPGRKFQGTTSRRAHDPARPARNPEDCPGRNHEAPRRRGASPVAGTSTPGSP